MPTAMHPWMDPERELGSGRTRTREIYEAFDRIFDCRGHGWANLQSVHINLPFAGDEEFGRLHAAMRLLLPILPALAASSPFVDGGATACSTPGSTCIAATRARCRRSRARSCPEPVCSPASTRSAARPHLRATSRRSIPEGMLRHEWVNARGAIARFDRMAHRDPRARRAGDAADGRSLRCFDRQMLKLLCDKQSIDRAGLGSLGARRISAALLKVDGTASEKGTAIGDKRYFAGLGLRGGETALEERCGSI